jgi:hypothetical protein
MHELGCPLSRQPELKAAAVCLQRLPAEQPALAQGIFEGERGEVGVV